ncbi:site-specific DNA-methyltransferase, partial [Kaistia algarum]
MSDKLKMHSPNLVDANIEKIAALFPNCITETKDENGELKKAVDFDLLKQELSQILVEGEQERYRLDWVGKKEAILTANAPIAKTLRPCREESVNFDKTENLFIEGDNLEALKLLQENYLGKVKMIYIDPPYNTGNDFIYEDDFAESTDAFFEKSNQVDEEGNRLIANTDSNGRFHSDWLSMMYSRLKLARNLLTENGVIVASIDDNEINSLKNLFNEIFGENNFLAQIVWEKIYTTKNDSAQFSNSHEYLLIFAKN